MKAPRIVSLLISSLLLSLGAGCTTPINALVNPDGLQKTLRHSSTFKIGRIWVQSGRNAHPKLVGSVSRAVPTDDMPAVHLLVTFRDALGHDVHVERVPFDAPRGWGTKGGTVAIEHDLAQFPSNAVAVDVQIVEEPAAGRHVAPRAQ